ncbi:sensor histidine kinase [Thermobifida cellulosilytica]|nr:sensor histidine kinase [Thermobifida cellulosilytica]
MPLLPPPGWPPAAVPETDERSMRRLRFSQGVVFISLAVCALVILLLSLLQLVSDAAEEKAPRGLFALFGLGMPWYASAIAVLTAVLAWLTVQIIRLRMAAVPDRSSPDALLYWSFGLLLGLVAVMDVTWWSVTVATVWWSAAVLVASRRQMALLTAGLAAFVAGYTLLSSQPPLLAVVFLGYGCGLTLLFVAGNVAMLWLWEIAREATLAREARARLAVSEERLRFARDMHDLLGHSLSGIAVKSELAARLAARDPERAAAEMAEVQQIAREALREVRAAVSGYRSVDLAEELASVRSVLTAAGVRTTVTGSAAALPEQSRSLVAWLVREGATNVLRHSSARRCDITLVERDRSCVVEVYNDGVRPGRETVFGNGLTGLSERVAAVGGTLSATGTGDGGFLLRAVVPAPGSASPRPAETPEAKGGAA